MSGGRGYLEICRPSHSEDKYYNRLIILDSAIQSDLLRARATPWASINEFDCMIEAITN